MLKKLIIMDIDGTLVNSERIITPKTKEALMRVQKEGARLVLASGRPTSGLSSLAKELKMDQYHGLLISFNGSKVIDAQSEEVLFDEPMTVLEAKAVLRHLKQFQHVRALIDYDDYMLVEDVYHSNIDYQGKEFNVIAYESRGNRYKLMEVDDLEEFIERPINKILTFSSPDYLNAHYKEMMEPFKDSLSSMFTSPFYFEYTAKGIDKAKALNHILKDFDYAKEDLIAFGDGQNDMSLLKAAGIGVAMENACDELKKVATDITLSNNEDGIAFSLYKYFPQIFAEEKLIK